MTPISLPSIASVLLKDDFDVVIIDCIAVDMSFDQLRQRLGSEKPSFVLVNVATVSFNTDKQVADICKELEIPVAAFGVHVTTTPDETLRKTSFDFLIRGEPELIALKLARCVRDKGNPGEVLGISFTRKTTIVHNKDAPRQDNLDALPFPARNLLDNQKYIAPLSHNPYTLLIASRGCPFNCIYCTAHQYYGKKTRSRSTANILAEMRHIASNLGIRNIAMWSDTFTLNKPFVLELCKKIKESKLDVEWYCNSRVDTVDEEMIREMAAANCKVITLGVESLDQRILDNMRKGTRVEQIKKTIVLCRKYGVKTQAHLIFGLPGENSDSVSNTIRGIMEADPDYAEFYCAVPFPGTEFHAMARKHKWLTTTDYSKFEINQAIISYPHLSDVDIKSSMRRAYRAFYLRPIYLFRKLKEWPIWEWPSISKQVLSWAKDWIYK
jgi:radical SAM superfamily enzyme YgiQ (UPF0313 family)